jgi:poly(A) polymerase
MSVPERSTRKLAVDVVRRLRQAGHEALLAGGCVRDMLLGRRPTDYDVATSATPEQVAALFRRVLMVGAKFGVAMVIDRGRRIEVSTFRSDVSYSDGRRPDAVRFVSAREDASRRDFTINGMFLDPLTDEVVDYVGGQADLEAGVVRAIGDPDTRFREDYLRTLRAVRFAVRLGFDLEPATRAAIARHAGRIVEISGERVREELEKMLSGAAGAEAADLLADLGLLEAILPELFAPPQRWRAARERLAEVAPAGELLLSLGGLLCELSRDELAGIARRWGASNRMRDAMTWLAEHLDDWRDLPDRPAPLKRLMIHPAWPALLELWKVRERRMTGGQERTARLAEQAGRIPAERVRPEPFVAGADLLNMGMRPGSRLGNVLARLYEEQLDERLAGRDEALARARELMGRKD